MPAAMLVVSCVAPSMTVTVPGCVTCSVAFATYTLFVDGLTATEYGSSPTGIVAITVLADPSMTETVPVQMLATYTRFVIAFTAMPRGLVPTAMFVVSLVVPSMAVTLSPMMSAT